MLPCAAAQMQMDFPAHLERPFTASPPFCIFSHSSQIRLDTVCHRNEPTLRSYTSASPSGVLSFRLEPSAFGILYHYQAAV